MKKILKRFFLVLPLVVLLGCARIYDSAKIIWGSSLVELENARVDGVTQMYACGFDECFDSVLELTKESPAQEETGKNPYTLFLKNRVRGVIVLMGVPGNINTTEVGVFFEEYGDNLVDIEIASPSSNAQRTVVQDVFSFLDERFTRK